MFITVHVHLGAPEGDKGASAFMQQYSTRDGAHREQGEKVQKEEQQDEIVFMRISLTVSDFPSLQPQSYE